MVSNYTEAAAEYIQLCVPQPFIHILSAGDSWLTKGLTTYFRLIL